MAEKLAACPFCGGTFFGESHSPGVNCLGCFAKGPQIIGNALPMPKSAIKVWNSRPGEQAILKLLKMTADGYKEMLTLYHNDDKATNDVLEEAYKLIKAPNAN